jgi:hypothetical protein
MNIQRPDGVELRLAGAPRRKVLRNEVNSKRRDVATVAALVIAVLGAGYLLLSASVTLFLIVGAALLLTIGFVVAFGFWVQNNTPIL